MKYAASAALTALLSLCLSTSAQSGGTGATLARQEDDVPPTASAVCAGEKRAWNEAKERYGEKHPALLKARARARAACVPAPTAECALARADLAGARMSYLSKHPSLLAARKAVRQACR